MCCYEQCILLWEVMGGKSNRRKWRQLCFAAKETVIYPRKAQRNWRRTKRNKLTAETRGLNKCLEQLC